MVEVPELQVRMFLDVRRDLGDTSIDSELLRRFREQFRKKDWPSGKRLPELLYFPPSMDMHAQDRSVLHAKCIVADSEAVFISSANFTEAAQNRNIEIGLLVRSAALASRITSHFDAMLAQGFLKPIP
jgi:phosphatidylserine/phosphatidylglycerophosphate/cardiolipin synthase-like enzyme